METEHLNDSSNGNHHAGHHSSEWTFQELLVVLRRGRWTIVLALLIVLSAVGLYTFESRPVYEASASVLIDSKSKAGSFPVLDITGAGLTTKITNELETLRSRSLAEAVAQSLKEKRFVDDAQTIPIAVIQADDRCDSTSRCASTPEIVRRLTKAVEFSAVKESDIIKITARSSNPDETCLIVNTYTQDYAARDLSMSRTKSRVVREFLQSQLGSKHHQLDSTERSLQGYMTRSGVVSLDAETERVVKQLSALEASRDGLEVEIAAVQRTLTSLKAELAVQEPNVARAIGESNDAYIKLLQSQLARLEVQRDLIVAQNVPEGTVQVGMTAEKLTDLDKQITQLKKTLHTRTESFLGSVVPESGLPTGGQGSAGVLGQFKQKIIEQQIELDGLIAKKEALVNVIGDYEQQFNQIPQKSIELAKLQRSRLSSEKLYLLVEEKYNEAAITETSELGSVNVLDPAVVPLDPISPRPLLNMAIALLLGLGSGIGITIVRSSLDTRLRSPDDLKRLGVTPIGIIQQTEKKVLKGFAMSRSFSQGKAFDPTLVAYHNPLLPDSEGYRHLRTAIQDSVDKDPLGVIAITSANPQEGKSTIAANLAVSFALMEGNCLLIDADLRRPTVQQMFGLSRGPGLTNVLAGLKDFEDVVHTKVVENLDVLTAGDAVKTPAELLGGKMMKELMESIRSKYRIILVDTSPLLAVTDAGVLARVVDGVIMVVQSNATTAEMLEAAGERLKSQHHNFLGLVLNKFDAKSAYGSYRYAYKIGYGPYEYTSSKGTKKRRHHT